MNEAKFTPGPWKVGGNGGFVNQLQIEPTIGCAYGAGDEIKANAHLIAAAPDLYEALEEVDRMVMDMICRRDTYPQEGSIGFKVKAALAKARGE